VLSDGAAARSVLFATVPVRTEMRCIPLIAAGNKTGPVPGKSLCAERSGF
jgi:hypothetical protein